MTKIPTTFAELEQVANLPFSEARGIISQADSNLVRKWGESIYPNFGFGYLHSSDHSAALRIILNREPTYREVYDSYHSGSKNINLAREKMGAGLRPTGWDNWTDEQKRYSVLVHLYGITAGSRILDGKRKDPSPEKTKALMVLWGLNEKEPQEPEKPKEPDTPTDKPTDKPAPKSTMEVEIKLSLGSVVTVYSGLLTEK